MSYHLKVLRDSPIAYYPLDGSAEDISGAENHGQMVGVFKDNILPIVSGSTKSTLVEYPSNYIFVTPVNDYTGEEQSEVFGTYSTSKNEFSIEFWIKPNITYHNSITTIIQDSYTDPRLVIYFYEGYLHFAVYSSEDYTYYDAKGYVNFIEKALHVVAIYSKNNISIYVDGALLESTQLPNNFKFYGGPDSTPYPVNLKISPEEMSNKFLINNLAIYRYPLSKNTIMSHYIEGNIQIDPKQIAISNNGKVFDLNSAKLYESFIYLYPADKSLDSFIDTNNSDYIYYDSTFKSIKFYKTSSPTDVVLEDFILIPEGIGTTSKIEWRGDYGIKIETSEDGNTYEECINGGTIPQYKRGSYSESKQLYIRITLSSTSTAPVLYSPEFSFMSIVFYRDKTIYSDNGGGKIYFPPDLDTDADIDLGTLNYPTLSRHRNNGVRVNKGFVLSTPNSWGTVQTIELFFTPISLNSCPLLLGNYPFGYYASYSWNSAGTISKSNISKFYVNGVEKAAETDIHNVFIAGQTHHVVIVFSDLVGADIYFNYNPNNNTYGPDNSYNNIICYENSLDVSDITTNYNMWTGRPNSIIVNNPIIVEEKIVKIDDVDWVVVQSS